jgi:hypothetical protein
MELVGLESTTSWVRSGKPSGVESADDSLWKGHSIHGDRVMTGYPRERAIRERWSPPITGKRLASIGRK